MPKSIEINKRILQSIKDGNPLANNSYLFICQSIDMLGDAWKYVASLNAQVGLVNEHDLVISQLRIRQLDTFFIFSSNPNLQDVSSKEDIALTSLFMTTLNHDLQLVDVERALIDGYIVIRRTIKPEQFLRDLMTTEEYQKMFI